MLPVNLLRGGENGCKNVGPKYIEINTPAVLGRAVSLTAIEEYLLYVHPVLCELDIWRSR